MSEELTPLAHSAPQDGSRGPQEYCNHTRSVAHGSLQHAEKMLEYATHKMSPQWGQAIEQAGYFHDLGKLDPDNQKVLRRGRGGRLPVDHMDAGIAHLLEQRCELAAWLVRSHHAPGIPSKSGESVRKVPLRGLRDRASPWCEHRYLIERTDGLLRTLLKLHFSVLQHSGATPCRVKHGMPLRLALSCLVDADHTDTSEYDYGTSKLTIPDVRWEDRLQLLDGYVSHLAEGKVSDRSAIRDSFYQQARGAKFADERFVACEGPVGIGKTTAIAAYLFQIAIRHRLRRLVIVVPYTNVISQTVETLRNAIVLPGEDAARVVTEHHHRVEFGSRETREYAVTWRSPIVVTTAVQFFETLAANKPASLRKLHQLPGSAVYIDEAHACWPVHLWPQAWRWMQELAADWKCHFVFGSGSLVRFWEHSSIATSNPNIPVIASESTARAVKLEHNRIEYQRIDDKLSLARLCKLVDAAPSPRLVILNTVQSAAVVATELRKGNKNILHLSTALTPADREEVLKEVRDQLALSKNFTLVATSCIEAGVDLSFAVGFREAATTASLIQVGGRVNRNSEYSRGIVYSFCLDHEDLLTKHPLLDETARVLNELFDEGKLVAADPAELASEAFRRELAEQGLLDKAVLLMEVENAFDYPEVARLGRVIEGDTRTVVVDQQLQKRIEEFERVSTTELMRGSVQLWSYKIHQLGMEEYRPGLYFWKGEYDRFLGVMAGILPTLEFAKNGGGIV